MCENFISGSFDPRTWRCKAFPNGIPDSKIAKITRDPCVNCNNGIGFVKKEEDKND